MLLGKDESNPATEHSQILHLSKVLWEYGVHLKASKKFSREYKEKKFIIIKLSSKS